MVEAETPKLADSLARAGALDTSCSVLVQAPAGSGKTELLAMRFLKLLGEVEEPQQVLAITFAKAATAEIRHRILGRLEEARGYLDSGDTPPAEKIESINLAQAAYTNSVKHGWRLLDQPHRIDIQTIDSLCLRIAHQMPLSGRPGCLLQPTEEATPLYRRAARKTLDRLGGDDEELNAALRALLLLRDSNLKDCEGLLEEMLETRDQWMRAFQSAEEVDWEAVFARFEEPFALEVDRVLGELHAALSSDAKCADELADLLRYAAGNVNPDHRLSIFADTTGLPQPKADCLGYWLALRDILTTSAGEWRKGFDKRIGFPARGTAQKLQMSSLIADLAEIPGILPRLIDLAELPACRYTHEERENLRHIFIALRQAVRELDAVFMEEGAVDFVELGLAARNVLSREDGQALATRHLLVDEFQDTSRTQHELIIVLLRDWTRDQSADGPCTIFLVGDPMQSIYMFRQADVELFELVRTRGIPLNPTPLSVKPLKLETNFRSHAGLVNRLNAMFTTIFPHNVKDSSANVEFLPAVPAGLAKIERPYKIHCNFCGSEKSSRDDAQREETDAVVRIVQSHMPAIEEARERGGEFTVAILGSARNHLAKIAGALRELEIPFRALELEELGQRQEVLDLQSLTRALLHPVDRIAWLSLLRAPWCGLELRDLHLLCGSDEASVSRVAVLEQIQLHIHLLSEETKARVERLIAVLSAALANRHRQSSFSSWIERTWNSLGGPACVDAAGHENAHAYFRMLEEVSADGIDATGDVMQERLSCLHAVPDPSVSDRCGVQLMTVHKAKGLGFDVVVLPGLEKAGAKDSQNLVCFLERSAGIETEFLISPIGSKGDDSSSTYSWVGRQRRNREAEERKRLLYVACTRARLELHLFGTATVTNGKLRPGTGSLLQTAWPALEQVFQESYMQTRAAQPVADVLAFPSEPIAEPLGSGMLDRLAAAGGKSILRRLPLGAGLTPPGANISWRIQETPAAPSEDDVDSRRPQASRPTRMLGTTVHALFERAARLMNHGASKMDIRAALPRLQAQAQALVRSEGLTPHEAEVIAQSAVRALESAIADPFGLWILGPHLEAGFESSWTGVIDGEVRTLRIDRSFRAGAEPFSEGTDYLWIIDYKTATHGLSGLAKFLDAEKLQYAEQLQGYARMMRLLHRNDMQLRLGLYYPLLQKLIWWPA